MEDPEKNHYVYHFDYMLAETKIAYLQLLLTTDANVVFKNIEELCSKIKKNDTAHFFRRQASGEKFESIQEELQRYESTLEFLKSLDVLQTSSVAMSRSPK